MGENRKSNPELMPNPMFSTMRLHNLDFLFPIPPIGRTHLCTSRQLREQCMEPSADRGRCPRTSVPPRTIGTPHTRPSGLYGSASLSSRVWRRCQFARGAVALLGRMLRLISERPLNSIVTPRRNTPPGTVGVIVVGRGTKLSRNVAPDRLLAEAGGKLISGGKSVAVALGSPQLCQLQPSMVPGRRTIAGAAGAILAINQAPGMGGSSRVTGGCAEFPDHGGEGGMREHTWLHNSAHGDDPLWQNSSFDCTHVQVAAAALHVDFTGVRMPG